MTIFNIIRLGICALTSIIGIGSLYVATPDYGQANWKGVAIAFGFFILALIWRPT